MKLNLIADGTLAAGGSSVLMTHNERLADKLDEFTRAIAAISKKRNKTEADEEEIGRLEFYGGLYTHPVIQGPEDLNGQKPIYPAWNVLRCLQAGATRQKRGKDVLRGIYPLAQHAEITAEGPMDVVERWTGGFWIRKTVGVQRNRLVRTRAIYTEWRLELPVEVDPNVFDLHTVKVAWRDAGTYEGLGEMRPVQGRFAGTVEVIEADTDEVVVEA